MGIIYVIILHLNTYIDIIFHECLPSASIAKSRLKAMCLEFANIKVVQNIYVLLYKIEQYVEGSLKVNFIFDVDAPEKTLFLIMIICGVNGEAGGG